MDPFTLIGVAANLARVIIHLSYTYKLQQTHIGILVDRITSLEKPLETLERAGKGNAEKISEAALRKLIGTLEEVQRMILEHQRTDNKSKTKRFLFGDANMDDLKLIRERLDSSLLDLQLAITVEEAGNSEKRVHLTARATVDILLSSVTQRATEAILKCVQCGLEYRQSENPVGSCKYHPSFPHFKNWKYSVECCGKEFKSEDETHAADCEGCVRGVHCDFHHTQYPYAAYFLWMRGQVFNNVKETWLKVTDWDFEDNVEKYAMFGVSKDNLLFVALGKGNFPLFLQYFDPNNMPQVAAPMIGDMMTIAMRGSDIQPGESEWVETPNKWIVDALWTLDQNARINGVRLSANSLSSKFPIIKELSLSFNPLTKGNLRVLSYSSAPAKGVFTDPLPECNSNFMPFPDSVFQQPPMEPTYETVNTSNIQVRLKKNGKCDANPEFSGFSTDTFVLPLYVMNLAQGASLGSSTEERMVVLNMLKDGKMGVEEAIKLLSTLDASPHHHGALTFIDVRARFYINDRWVNGTGVVAKIKKEEKMIPGLPFEVPPRAATNVVLECTIDSPGKKNARAGWFHRAYISRLSPITIEVTFEEMSGATSSIMAQFANPPQEFHTPKDDYLYWLYVDDLKYWDRIHITILSPNLKDYPEACCELHLNGTRVLPVTFKDLLRWGYEAAKTNSTIFEIKEYTQESHTVWGLVDLVAGVVCGFKMQVRVGESSYNEGLWMIPDDLFLASRRALLGDEVEKALWQTTDVKPSQPSPPVAKPAFGSRSARQPPSNPPPPTPPSSHAPPSNPLPPVPSVTTPPSTRPPSAQPPSAQPPSAQPPSAQNGGARAGTQPNGFVRTTPAPPPRQFSAQNGLGAKPAASPSPSPSPAPAPAPSPAPSPSPSPAPSATSPASTPISPVIAAALFTPPPLNQPSPAPTPAPTHKGEIVMRCGQCTFGNKKDECVKCKSNVPPAPTPSPGLMCTACKTQNRSKCYTCNTIITPGMKSNPSVLCAKCSFGVQKDKCIKCNKLIS